MVYRLQYAIQDMQRLRFENLQIDLLQVAADGKICAYEIKSGKTFRTDYFDGLHYLQKVLGDRLSGTCVLYDGEQELHQQYDAYCHYTHCEWVESYL